MPIQFLVNHPNQTLVKYPPLVEGDFGLCWGQCIAQMCNQSERTFIEPFKMFCTIENECETYPSFANDYPARIARLEEFISNYHLTVIVQQQIKESHKAWFALPQQIRGDFSMAQRAKTESDYELRYKFKANMIRLALMNLNRVDPVEDIVPGRLDFEKIQRLLRTKGMLLFAGQFGAQYYSTPAQFKGYSVGGVQVHQHPKGTRIETAVSHETHNILVVGVEKKGNQTLIFYLDPTADKINEQKGLPLLRVMSLRLLNFNMFNILSELAPKSEFRLPVEGQELSALQGPDFNITAGTPAPYIMACEHYDDIQTLYCD